jgi:alanyl-tRNA synthetase
LKKLASAITSDPGIVAVLITEESPSLVVVARSQDLALDTGVVLKKLLDRFGGKGGGKGSMAQGGGLSGSPQEILSAAKEAL